MRIKTITCHHVYNYGASLQAYALQHYLIRLGHEVEIIDYRPSFLSGRYNCFHERYFAGRISCLVKICPFLRYIIGPFKAWRAGMFKTWERKSPFDQFNKDYYHLTSKTYSSAEELRSDSPQADLYIAGSDQIWNTDCHNGKDPSFYLDFGPSQTKRISYAASFAVKSIPSEMTHFVRNRLKSLDAISVREQTGVEILKKLGLNGEKVLDPVFLLDKQEWKELAERSKKYNLPKDYILVYDFLTDDRVKQLADILKLRYNIPIVSINALKIWPYADIDINDAGPLEFLSLVSNARFIVATSFHAVAFSVIFEKEFYVFPLRTQANSSRMEDFLKEFGAYGRYLCTKEQESLDYEKIKMILENKIRLSKGFLDKALS